MPELGRPYPREPARIPFVLTHDWHLHANKLWPDLAAGERPGVREVMPGELRAAASRVLGALAEWETPPFIVVAQAVCALRGAGGGLPIARPRLAEVLFRVLANDVIDEDLAPEVLEQLDGLIPQRLAQHLADVLHRRGLAPYYRRLPRLLLPVHAELAWRCVRDAEQLLGGDEQWLALLFESQVAAIDNQLELPHDLVERVDKGLRRTELDARIAGYEARLRLAARRAPSNATALADEAISEVGASSVEDGLVALGARLIIAAPQVFDEWHARVPVDASALLGKAAALAGLDRAGAVSARLAHEAPHDASQQYVIAFEQLAAAALLGQGEVAAAVLVQSGLPAWAVYVASGKALRRFGLRGGDAATFIEVVTNALNGAAEVKGTDVPRPPPWAELAPSVQTLLWRLDAEPMLDTPWWTPWGGSLP